MQLPEKTLLRWLVILPMLAWLGNALYALGTPGGWLKQYSPALVASALIAYAVLHGKMRYGGAALGRFTLIVFAIAWSVETMSLITGFPFGNYHYTEIMAPYLWHVPVFVLPAYALMGYISWSLATLILKRCTARPDLIACLIVPPVAAALMVMWDLSMDPLRATLEGRWIWLDGGKHFGVPISNYFGWLGVTWLMFQIYALYLHLKPVRSLPAPVHSRRYWLSVPVAYLAFTGEYLLNPIANPSANEFVLINGTQVSAQTLFSQTATLCFATMVPLAFLGLLAALRNSPAAAVRQDATTPLAAAKEDRY